MNFFSVSDRLLGYGNNYLTREKRVKGTAPTHQSPNNRKSRLNDVYFYSDLSKMFNDTGLVAH